MRNISFDNPYWLLLAIPLAIALLVPYFISVSKDNRSKGWIASLVIHVLIIISVSLAAAGLVHTTVMTRTKVYVVADEKPVFLFYSLINGWMKHYTGHSMNYGPINVIHKLKKPLLMLHSREDIYSTPEYAAKLFELAGSDMKEIKWFPKGKHSMLRITDTERYDTAIADFIRSLDEKSN